jgi:5-methylcytosine-specific restriction enzyme A
MARARVCHYCQQTSVGPCPKCKPKIDTQRAEDRKLFDQQRGSAAKRGYGHKWRKERAAWLAMPENHFCVYCIQKNEKRRTIATTIDHFIPHRGDPKLFWDRKNWRASCQTCHNEKTARGQ